jgi:putative DNA primase/helicase
MNATDKKILVDGLKNGNPSKAIYEFILERTKDPNFDTITDRKQGEKQIRELLRKHANGCGQLITGKLHGWFMFAEKLNIRKHRLTIPELVQYVFDIYEDRIIFSDVWLRVYQDGYWKKVPDSEIINLVYRIDGTYANPSRYSSVVKTIKHLKDKGSLTPNHNLICLENGTLDPRTGKLQKHSHEHLLLNKLPVQWKANARCPIWKRTLHQIFDKDPEKKVKTDLIQELMGYLLTAETSQHKFFWMVGNGRNGKSLILKILERLCGSENCTAMQLHRLNNSHIRAGLLNKLVNISSEIEPGEKIPTSLLKAIVAGDQIEADEKGKSSITFRPYCRMIACLNPEADKLPKINDSSHGFMARAIFLKFERTFKDHEQDKGLEQKLIKELSAILVWAVAGLQRLNKRGRFIVPASSRELVQEFILDSKPVKKFARDALTHDTNGRLSTTELFEAYKLYGKVTKHKIGNASVFGKELQALNLNSIKSQGKIRWKVKISKEYLPKEK